MRRMFNPNNPIIKFLTMMADLSLLNLYWLIACIPVVTIGAATAALHNCIVRRYEGPMEVTREFWSALRRNFKQGSLLFLVLALLGLFMAFTLYLVLFVDMKLPFYFRMVLLIPHFVLLNVYMLVFPLQAQFENTTWQTLKNALFMALAYPYKTLLVTIITLLPVILAFLLPLVFLFTSVIWLFFGFAGSAHINYLLLRPIFKKYMQK